MKKKFLWLTLSLLLLTGCAAPAEPEQSEQPKETGYVQQLSDAVALCREELSVGLNALTELDTQLLGGAQTKEGGYTLAVWQLRCGEQALLLWRLDCAAAKENPGALDAIHLTWDGADYDRSEGDGVYSTVRGRDSKSVSFNVEDDRLPAGGSSCGAVYLRGTAHHWQVRMENTFHAEETVLFVTQGDGRVTTTAATKQVPRSAELSVAAQLEQEDTP